LLSALLAILAIPCAIYGLVTASPPFLVAALVTYLTSVAELWLWDFLFQTPLTYAFLQPLAAVVWLFGVLDSAIRGNHA